MRDQPALGAGCGGGRKSFSESVSGVAAAGAVCAQCGADSVLAEVRRGARDGLTAGEIAQRCGVGIARVRFLARRDGIALRPAGRIVGVDHRAQVQGMRPLAAVAYLLDVIEALLPEAMVDGAVDPLPGVALPRRLRVVLLALAQARGRVVERWALEEAMEVSGRGEVKGCSLAVAICALRPQIAPSGLVIRNVLGQGYAMDVPPGWRWPWERAVPA